MNGSVLVDGMVDVGPFQKANKLTIQVAIQKFE